MGLFLIRKCAVLPQGVTTDEWKLLLVEHLWILRGHNRPHYTNSILLNFTYNTWLFLLTMSWRGRETDILNRCMQTWTVSSIFPLLLQERGSDSFSIFSVKLALGWNQTWSCAIWSGTLRHSYTLCAYAAQLCFGRNWSFLSRRRTLPALGIALPQLGYTIYEIIGPFLFGSTSMTVSTL